MAPAAKEETVKFTKMDAVREALKELGDDASVGDIREFILKRHKNMDMEKSMLSAYKSKILAEERGGEDGEDGKTRRKRKQKDLSLTDLRTLRKQLQEKEIKLQTAYDLVKAMNEIAEDDTFDGSVEQVVHGIQALYEFEFGSTE